MNSLWQEEGVCYVNLAAAALGTLPEDARLDLALQALASSLSGLETVEEVRFLVDGEFAAHYGGTSLTPPYTRK